ncbi:MAG: response regulator [Bdellovibrionaceae bacterium]|nr:response regulator [Pseudobdellovibrionaceae bacterium]
MGDSERKINILLVDDSVDILNICKDFLEKLNTNVFTAENGAEAIDKIRDGLNVDAIIMDIEMPVMDGVSAIQKISTLGYKKCIFINSGISTNKIIKMLGEYKVSGILNKSELSTELIEVVKKIKNKIDLG